jgi:hypothetical protein
VRRGAKVGAAVLEALERRRRVLPVDPGVDDRVQTGGGRGKELTRIGSCCNGVVLLTGRRLLILRPLDRLEVDRTASRIRSSATQPETKAATRRASTITWVLVTRRFWHAAHNSDTALTSGCGA